MSAPRAHLTATDAQETRLPRRRYPPTCNVTRNFATLIYTARERARSSTPIAREFMSDGLARSNGMLSALAIGWTQDGKGEAIMMSHIQPNVAVNARLLKIGLEVFPVYGDEQSGWSVDPGDLYPQMPHLFRYRSLDELFFALVNLNISSEGQA